MSWKILLFPLSLYIVLVIGWMSIVMFPAGESPPVALALSDWARVSMNDGTPSFALPEAVVGGKLSMDDPPGRFRARYQLETRGVATLYDVLRGLGKPQWVSCSEHTLCALGQPVTWMRLGFNEGQIQAYIPLTGSVLYLDSNTPVSILRFYKASQLEVLPHRQVWQGMVPTSAYDNCSPDPWDCIFLNPLVAITKPAGSL